MTGSSRNSKATSSPSSKSSERLSSSIRKIQGVARPSVPRFGSNQCGNRHEPQAVVHPQTLARARTISEPAGKFDWRFHHVQQGAHDDHDQPSERINPIFCMKNGEIGRHVAGLFMFGRWKQMQAAQITSRPPSAWHLKPRRVMVDGPPMLPKVRAPPERCLSKIAHGQSELSRPPRIAGDNNQSACVPWYYHPAFRRGSSASAFSRSILLRSPALNPNSANAFTYSLPKRNG